MRESSRGAAAGLNMLKQPHYLSWHLAECTKDKDARRPLLVAPAAIRLISLAKFASLALRERATTDKSVASWLLLPPQSLPQPIDPLARLRLAEPLLERLGVVRLFAQRLEVTRLRAGHRLVAGGPVGSPPPLRGRQAQLGAAAP